MVPALIVGFGTSERIDSVVLRMAAVTLHPMPFDAMGRAGVDQFLPQLGILDRFPVGRPPSVLPPLVNPPRDSIADVNAVGMKLDSAGLVQRLEATDGGKQLHPVV